MELIDKKGNRFAGIDLLKFLLALLVILIHVPTLWENEYYTIYVKPIITRFAVPCFFIISGWFLYGDKTYKKSFRSLKKLALITVLSYIVYYFIYGMQNIDYWDIRNFVLFNSTDKFGFHLWYLYAYIYVLIIVALFTKRIWQIAFLAIPFLLLMELCMGKYSILLMGREFLVLYCRNFLVTGLTYVLIGAFLKKLDISIGSRMLLISIFLFSVLTLTEKLILRYYGIEAPRETYICTPFLAVAVFLLFKDMNVSQNLFTYLGRKYSLWIYIIHPAILKVFI